MTFRHPLIRSAAVEASTAAERRRAHRDLAAVLADQPERRAWHLGEAAVEPDEEVARLLEDAAHRIYQRGDYFGAVARLTRAAELSPAAADRGRRLAEAAYIGAEALGEIKSTFRLLEGTRQADPHLGDPLYYASAAAFVMLNADGHIDTAHRMLTGAIEGGDHHYDSGDRGADQSVVDTGPDLLLGGRRELWDPFYAALGRLSPRPAARTRADHRYVRRPCPYRGRRAAPVRGRAVHRAPRDRPARDQQHRGRRDVCGPPG